MNITNGLVTEYLNGYYRPVSACLKSLREEGEKDFIPIILKETESFLALILSLKKPHKILEIGTAIGYSAIFFASACENAEIYTVEKNDKMFLRAADNIEKAGFGKRIFLLFGDGEEVTEKIGGKGISGFDFVFIDASKAHYRRFMDAVLPLCEDGAVIVSDNILQRAMTASDIYDEKKKHKTIIRRMREYVDYIATDPRFDTTFLSVGDGLAVTIYRGRAHSV